MKLFRVKLQGMKVRGFCPGIGDSFVVADDPTGAYMAVRDYVDAEDIGFPKDRELKSVELICQQVFPLPFHHPLVVILLGSIETYLYLLNLALSGYRLVQ